MERIKEIEARMGEIATLLDNPEADLDALEAEVRSLEAEKAEIVEKAEKRAALLNDVNQNGTLLKTFEGDNTNMEQRTFGIETMEYRNAWLKNLQGKELDVEERAAMTASAAIPTETLNKVVGKLELNPIINAVDVMHIPGGVTIPVETTSNSANWVAMGTAATDSADALTPVTLAAYKLIKTIEITADVKAMSVDAFESWLVARLANKIECAVAAGIVAGTGSSQATGLNTISATGTWTKAGMTYADLMTIIGSLGTNYAANASFVVNRTVFYGQILGMVDTTKKPIVVADPQAPAKFSILGFPVIIDDNAVGVVFGDLKEGYKFNFAADVDVRADESAGFRSGSVVYRGMCLCDGKPTGVGLVRYTQATA